MLWSGQRGISSALLLFVGLGQWRVFFVSHTLTLTIFLSIRAQTSWPDGLWHRMGTPWPVSAHSSPPWLGVLWPRTSQLQWPRSTEESWHWRGADTSSHHPPPLSHNVTSGGHAQVMTYESHGVLATLIHVCQKSLPSPNLTRSCVVAGGWGEVLTAVTAGLRMAQLSAAATAAVKYHFGQNGTDIVHTGCGEWGRGCLWQLNDDSFSIRLLCSNTKLIISLSHSAQKVQIPEPAPMTRGRAGLIIINLHGSIRHKYFPPPFSWLIICEKALK